MPPKLLDAPETLIDRRSFLLSTLSASAGLIWQGCSSSDSHSQAKLVSDAGNDAAATGMDASMDAAGVDGGVGSAFGVLRTLRDVIRSSPDHLAARAAEAIASNDPARAIQFVRTSIAVLPPPDSITAAVDAVRWGPAATLRAGAGTLRERAELLAAMLAAMGATTKVVRAARPSSVSAASLYGTSSPAFAPDAAQLASFVATPKGAAFANLGAPSDDPDPTTLTKTLAGLLPAGTAVAKTPFDGDDPIVPVVEYTLGGSTRWAFAMGSVDDVSSSPPSLGGALIAPTYPTVSVRVLAQLGDVPGVPTPGTAVELAAGTWTTDQVAGQRLTIAFTPPDPQDAIQAPSQEIPIRVATLTLQGLPQDGNDTNSAYPPFRPSLAVEPKVGFTGAPFTLSGVQFTANADGSLTGPYGDLQNLASSAHDAAVASVSTLEVVANGGAFPDVQLTVRALDGSGTPVFGLGVGDFTVTDESKAQQALLVSNAQVEGVRVLVAYDCSGSVVWPTPADKTAFDDAIAQALVSSAAKNPFKLAVTPLGGSAAASAFVDPVASDVVAFVSNCAGFSDLWTSLGQIAVDAGVSAVIIVSDFDASDDPSAIPGLQQRLAASGLQVALIPVATPNQSTIDQIVAIAGATQLDPKATDFQTQLDDFVTTATERVTNSGYRFFYRVPSDQRTATTRTATVALAKRTTITASGAYTVPAVAQRGLRGVAGLSLEIRIGADTATRWLSGPHANRFGGFPTPTATDLANTEALLNGQVTVAFEPGSPTVAANLDDVVSGVLSTEPIFRTIGMPGPAGLDAALSFHQYGTRLAALVDPVKRFDSGPVVAPKALRVVIESKSANGSDVVDRFDLAPELNRSVAASTDAALAFAAVMASTVGASLREGAVGFSAADRLATASLQYAAAGAAVTTLTGFAATDVARWSAILDYYGDYHRLIPTDPTLNAFWIIEPTTGSTFAVYLDGTGGSCDDAKWNGELQLDMLVLSIYATYKSLVCEKGSISCVGATAATVFAGVAAFFGGWYLDEASYLDLAVLIITLIAVKKGSNGLGVIATGLGAVLAIGETQDSLKNECP